MDSEYPALQPQFSKLYALFSLWLISGAYYDAFTHTHNPELETFFTLAHITIYTGGALLAALMGYTVWTNRKLGYSFWKAVPKGYDVSLLGAFFFFIAGAGDLAWHEIFGIEQDLEAAFSATHLILVTSFILLMSGPFNAAWIRKKDSRSLIEDWPIVISVAMMLASLSVITQWAHPFVRLQATIVTTPDPDVGHSIGILSIILQTVFMMSIILLTAKKRLMPVGGYTIVLLLNSVYLTAMQHTYPLNWVALITGLLTDLYYWRSGEFTDTKFRVFAALVPVLYFGLYFIFISIYYTLVWNAHIISGAIFFPVLISLVLSYLVKQPDQMDGV